MDYPPPVHSLTSRFFPRTPLGNASCGPHPTAREASSRTSTDAPPCDPRLTCRPAGLKIMTGLADRINLALEPHLTLTLEAAGLREQARNHPQPHAREIRRER